MNNDYKEKLNRLAEDISRGCRVISKDSISK